MSGISAMRLTLLYQTGEQSHAFMLVIATNRPEDLDVAVLDRMDEALEFPLPTACEREQLLQLYFNRCIVERCKRVVVRGCDPKSSTVTGTGPGLGSWLWQHATSMVAQFGLLAGSGSSGARICAGLNLWRRLAMAARMSGGKNRSAQQPTASELLDFAAGTTDQWVQRSRDPKLFISMQAAAGAPSRVVGGVEEAVLTAELAEQVVNWKHAEHAQKCELQLREAAMLRQRLRLQRRVQAEMRRLAAAEPAFTGLPGADGLVVGKSADKQEAVGDVEAVSQALQGVAAAIATVVDSVWLASAAPDAEPSASSPMRRWWR